MSHDDGKKTEDISRSDVILLGVSRTGKTPTSIYLANRGYKAMNIPLITKQEIPNQLRFEKSKTCVIGLYADPERLSDIRRNRVAMMNETSLPAYTGVDSVRKEVEDSKKLFKKYNWPIINVTRKSIYPIQAAALL